MKVVHDKKSLFYFMRIMKIIIKSIGWNKFYFSPLSSSLYILLTTYFFLSSILLLKTIKIYRISPLVWKTGCKQSYQGFRWCLIALCIVPKMKCVCRGVWKTRYKQSYQGFRGCHITKNIFPYVKHVCRGVWKTGYK